MESIKNKSIKTILIIAVVSIFGCDSFVNVDRPNSQLTTASVYESATTANAAMNDVYAQIRERGLITGKITGLSCLMGVYGDEFISYENGAYTTADFYSNSVLASNELVLSIWNASYNQIYAANAIMEGVQASPSLSVEQKDQLYGESLFIRALIHFYLGNVFGNVPYVTSTDFAVNSIISRTSLKDLYVNINTDLESAIDLLPNSYLGQYRTRANKLTAQALLARTYLYSGDFFKAEELASTLLANDGYFTLEKDLDDVFIKDSNETIWQLSPGSSGANTLEAISYIFYSGPPRKISLSPTFVESFDDNDWRFHHWLKKIDNGTQEWYHPYKYKQDNATGSSLEHSVVLRLAEQYLIRAEARAMTGDFEGAKNDLNTIRNRAGLGYTTATDTGQILQAIVEERKFELFSEFGHRFFDLKRLNLLEGTLNIKPGWSTTDSLWPIPQTELLNNPMLTPQNPGY